MSPKPPVSPLEQLESEYRQHRSALDSFAGEISTDISTLLDEKQVILGSPLERRVKSFAAIEEKLARKDIALASIFELDDLVGLRIMLLFPRDVTTVCELIKATFAVISEENTASRLSDDQFGYASIHYTLKLRPEWASVPRYGSFVDRRFELQVRTIAQHIWAAASHVSQYKNEASVPNAVRRAIYRLSALLETVDFELERVLDQREAYQKAIAAEPGRARNEPLNVDLLEQFLNATWPANRTANEHYATALTELLLLDIKTIDELKPIVCANIEAANAEEKRQVDRVRKEVAAGKSPAGSTEARASTGVYFTQVGLLRLALRAHFGQEKMSKVFQVSGAISKKSKQT